MEYMQYPISAEFLRRRKCKNKIKWNKFQKDRNCTYFCGAKNLNVS